MDKNIQLCILCSMSDFIIDPTNVEKDPIEQFRIWYEEYLKTSPQEPTAMFLATADHHGVPSGRVVLMKSYDQNGFVFHTNYKSRKGCDIEVNPFASLTFYWQAQHRQVRVFGKVQRLSEKESDDYFATRPKESCLGAWASHQGEVIASRSSLLDRLDKLRQKYANQNVPRPPEWGGYRVIPERMEFWQGRDNRIHDRVEYVKEGGLWKRQRLSP